MLSDYKTLLVYGLTKEEIQKIALKTERVTEVTADMGNTKIIDILNRVKKNVSETELPDEKVIIFNKYTDSEIQKKVKFIRNRIDNPVLAVVTPTSINWTFKDLLEHLIAEREFYKNQEGWKKWAELGKKLKKQEQVLI